MTRVAALILAAGTASRYRAADPSVPTKLVVPYDGVPLVRRAAMAALASRARSVVVVTGHAEEAVRKALAGLDLAFTHNADYATGLASSLRAGLIALPHDVAGALVLLGDMPGVTGDLLDRLIAAFETDPGADAVVPVHVGRRGNPALLARALFEPAARLTGDEGARRLLAGARALEVEAGVAAALDVDEPTALSRVPSETRE